jgi:hypothetical protein
VKADLRTGALPDDLKLFGFVFQSKAEIVYTVRCILHKDLEDDRRHDIRPAPG